MITVAHEIDCSDRVEIGDFSAIWPDFAAPC